MKKSDLVKAITSQVDVTADKAGKIINVIFDTIADGLVDGDSYNHDKFGTFKIVDRAPRKGRNPQTGEVVDIPEKKAVKLVVSGYLVNQINKKD
jgi:DNA-binding protein HU-beta